MPLYTANVLRDIYRTEEGERRNAISEDRDAKQDARRDRVARESTERTGIARDRLDLAKGADTRAADKAEQDALYKGLAFMSEAVQGATPQNYQTSFLPLVKATVGGETFAKLGLPETYDDEALANMGAMLSSLAGDDGLLSEKVMRQKLKLYTDKLDAKAKSDGTLKKGKLRNYQKKSDKVTEEWDGKKWVFKSKGPMWNDGKKTREPSEKEARAKLYEIAKYREKLARTGGFDELLLAMIAKDNPKLAEALRGKPPEEMERKLDEYEDYLNSFVKPKVDPAAQDPGDDPLNIRGTAPASAPAATPNLNALN